MPHPTTLPVGKEKSSMEKDATPFTPSVPLPAATLLVVAPISEASGNEKGAFKVLMVKRSSHGFFGSLTVFPGGKIDKSDSSPEWANLKTCGATHSSGAEAFNAEAALAAVRETFEETGVLIATGNGQRMDADTLETWRKKANKHPSEFANMCKALGLTPAISRVAPWNRFVTPPPVSKRFDTRFFVTTLSRPIQNTSVSADGRETESLAWHRPSEFLAMAQDKKIFLITPQIVTLEQLAKHTFRELEEFADGKRVRTAQELAAVVPGPPPGTAPIKPITSRPAERMQAANVGMLRVGEPLEGEKKGSKL